MSSSMWFSHIEIPLKQSLALSDNEINRFKRPVVKHKWTLEQKLTLSILVRWYSNNWRDKTRIFNAYFHGARLPENANRSFSENVLRAMWHDIDHKRHINSTLQTIWLNTAFSPSSSDWAVPRAALEDCAVKLDLSLQKHTSLNDSDTREYLVNEEPLRPQRGTKRKRCVHSFRGLSFDNESDFNYTPLHQRRLHSPLQIPSKAGIRRSEAQLLTPPSSSQRINSFNQSHLDKRLPRFAFRAFNNSSQGLNSSKGFRAGRFKEVFAIPSPPDIRSQTYRDDALRHINAVPDGSTSLISVTRNLLRALHHGCKMGSDSSIAVIDIYEVERSYLDNERRTFSRVQSVKGLQLNSPNGYDGSGEYLIWGEIKENAVTSCQTITQLLSNMLNKGNGSPFYLDVISSVKYSTTARNRIKQVGTPLTTRNGQAVGNLLKILRIPPMDLDDATYAIISDWRFYATRNGCWRKNKKFIQAIHQGYEKTNYKASLLESQRKISFGKSPEKENSSIQSEIPSNDSPVFQNTANQHEYEELNSRINRGMIGGRSMQDIIRIDLETEELSDDDECQDTALEDDPFIDRSDNHHVQDEDPKNQMNQSILDEERWKREFIYNLEEAIGMKKPKMEGFQR